MDQQNIGTRLARLWDEVRRSLSPVTGGRATLPSLITLIDSPTERTTAATDAVLAGLAVGSAVWLLRMRERQPWKVGLWSAAFGTLGLAAALGAVAHGFAMAPQTRQLIWQPLNLALGATIALFVAGVVQDTWGEQASRRVLPIALVSAGGFYVITLLRPGTFLLFVLYQSVCMLFALGAYGRLAWQGQLPGAAWMTAGVLITILASAIQASEQVRLNFIWEFDHNGVYHLVQMVGLVALLTGVQRSLAPNAAE